MSGSRARTTSTPKRPPARREGALNRAEDVAGIAMWDDMDAGYRDFVEAAFL
jgi:hypothetical protein